MKAGIQFVFSCPLGEADGAVSGLRGQMTGELQILTGKVLMDKEDVHSEYSEYKYICHGKA